MIPQILKAVIQIQKGLDRIAIDVKGLDRMAIDVNAQLQQLRAGEAQIGQAISDAATRVAQAIADLKAKADATAPDLSSDIAAIQADVTAIGQIAAQAPTTTP